MSTPIRGPGWNSLAVWCLLDPKAPVRVGVLSLVAGGRGVAFTYDDTWIRTGFALSGDMPLVKSPIVPEVQGELPGALADSMPDRWGERAIRALDNPPRASPLDFLYLAGDHRFGALGFSINQKVYEPHDRGPLPDLGSIESLTDLIDKIDDGGLLSDQEKLLASSTRTMGGAHAKALVSIDGEQWVAKFPRDTQVDMPLIEYASLRLAQRCGIHVAESKKLATLRGHVILVKRFDRDGYRRLHTLSAKTILQHGATPETPPEGQLSYAALAAFVRTAAQANSVNDAQREIFRRMVFNILIENTDDHEKNHAFIRDGVHWQLAPAYDILPTLQNIDSHGLEIGDLGAEGSLENALTQVAHFGLTRDQAIDEWFAMAAVVDRWKDSFKADGVTDHDISEIERFIDVDWRKAFRQKSAIDTLKSSNKSPSVVVSKKHSK